jgi:predicted Ser/Thr protein kinase
MAEHDPLRGALEQALGAQYDVLRLLGRGGMGAVYLARERLLERQVAIKVLPFEHASVEGRERFLREARTVARLTHANVVPLLSFGETGGTLFYIMRFVEGESLEMRLRRAGRMTAEEVREIVVQLADALAEAHQQGIVHRDLKPDNVLLDGATGRPMLTDFGIARQPAGASTLTGTGMIVGTPQYMSPEQAAGDKTVDGRSDLYSLGVMAYRMLAGRLPFTGEDAREIMMQHIASTPTPINVLVPDVPLDLADAVMRCLMKNPEDRWPDASSLRFAIASGADPVAVPESVEMLPRNGTRSVQMLYVFGVGLVSLFSYTDDPIWLRTGAILTGVWMTGIFVGTAVRGIRSGIGWRRALQMTFWPNSRSAMWWPRALRPPGDVFDRLPRFVRWSRIAQSIGVAILMAVSVPLILAATIAGDDRPAPRTFLFPAGFSSVMVALWLMGGPSLIALRRYKRNHNLTQREMDKLLSEPTHGSRFWERPVIAALMAAERRPAAAPMTNDALRDAIVELGAAVPEAARSIAREAADAADQLLHEIKAVESRIAEVAAQADPAEQARLAERISALGPESAAESEMTKRMRGLLRGQNDLFGQLEEHARDLRDRRERLRDHLQGLYLQMASYRAQMHGSDDTRALTEKVREVTRHLGRRIDAAREVEAVTRLSNTGATPR